jgi:hypothetical protein
MCQTQSSNGLSERCPQIGDLPKSPVPQLAALVPSAGTTTLKIELRSAESHERPLISHLRALLAARVSP